MLYLGKAMSLGAPMNSTSETKSKSAMTFHNAAPGAPAPVGPYSQAVSAGGLLFLSGQIALDAETNSLLAGGVAEQTKKVLENIAAVLSYSGSSSEHIVMSSIFLAEMSDFGVVNEIYGNFVSAANPPARQTVAVKELPLGALVEISVIATPAAV